MKYNGTLIGPASGKLGDKVFSRNRGGQYIRAYAIPTDPNTAEQQDVRDAMAECKTEWDGLTDSVRQAWRRYSLAFPRMSTIGVPRPVGGFQEFCRANIPRRQAVNRLGVTLALVTTPPDLGSAPPDPSPAVVIQSRTFAALIVTQPTPAPWLAESGAAMLVYVSGPQTALTNYFTRPYTLFACALGSSTTNPFGLVATALAPMTIGLRYFWRTRVLRADGTLAPPHTGFMVPS